MIVLLLSGVHLGPCQTSVMELFEKMPNPLQLGVAFLYPLRKPKGFLMFSGAIEKQQWAAMG